VQPHKWSAFLTTKRLIPVGANDAEFGLDFFDASLGVLVRAAARTAVWFQPERDHGTTLPDMDPRQREQIVYQGGISIVTSPRIATLFQKHKQAKLAEEAMKKEAEKALMEDECEAED
jgi:hypothetical protein